MTPETHAKSREGDPFQDPRLAVARRRLDDFIGLPDLSHRSFLDMGCGDGFASLAAFQAKASRVISVDANPFRIARTERIRDACSDPERWETRAGSILDVGFVSELPRADVVHAWNCLDQTGSVWSAIRNAASLTKRGGLFCLGAAKPDRRSETRSRRKRRYRRMSRLRRKWLEVQLALKAGIHPDRENDPVGYLAMAEGLSALEAAREWLDGAAFEPVSPGQLLSFLRREAAMELINLEVADFVAGYVFRKRNENS